MKINVDAVNYTISATDVTQAAVDSAIAGTKRVNQTVESMQAKMASQFSAYQRQFAIAAAGIYAAIQTLQSAWNLAEQAAQFEQSKMAFRSMAQSMGADADKLFAQLQEKSAGLIDQKTLIEAANRAMSLGIPIEKIGDLLEIARAKARDMGTQTAQAFGDIVTGIGRASPLILDNLGLILKVGAANEAMARQLGKNASELTEKEKAMAILNATIEAGQSALQRYNMEQLTTNERMQKLRAHVQDAQLWIGQLAIRGGMFLGGLIKSLQAVGWAAYWMGQKIKQGAAYALTQIPVIGKNYQAAYEDAKISAEAAYNFTADLLAEGNGLIKGAFAESQEFAMAMQKTQAAAGGGIAGGAGPDKATQKWAEEQWNTWKRLYDEYSKFQREMTLFGMNETDKRIADVDYQYKEQAFKLQEFWKAGILGYDEYTASVQALDQMTEQQKSAIYQEDWLRLQESLEQKYQLQLEFEQSLVELQKQANAMKLQNYQAFYDQMMAMANSVGSELGRGMGMFASSMKGMTDIGMGQDVYSKQIAEYNKQYDELEKKYSGHVEFKSQLDQASAERDLAIQEANAQKKLSLTSSTFGSMAGMAYSFYALSNQQSKEAFRAYQILATAQAIVDTYGMAVKAYNAMAGIPVVGPALGAAAAAAAIAFGMAQVNAIMSAKPGGGASASAPSPAPAGGYEYSNPTVPSWKQTEPVKQAPIIQITINGDVLNNHDELARKIVEPLAKAWADGAH